MGEKVMGVPLCCVCGLVAMTLHVQRGDGDLFRVCAGCVGEVDTMDEVEGSDR